MNTKLLSSVAGRVNMLVDLCELPKEAAIQAAMSDSQMAKLASRFSEIIEDQTLTLLNKLPISYLTDWTHWVRYPFRRLVMCIKRSNS
jgi:hypothetical protein